MKAVCVDEEAKELQLNVKRKKAKTKATAAPFGPAPLADEEAGVEDYDDGILEMMLAEIIDDDAAQEGSEAKENDAGERDPDHEDEEGRADETVDAHEVPDLDMDGNGIEDDSHPVWKALAAMQTHIAASVCVQVKYHCRLVAEAHAHVEGQA